MNQENKTTPTQQANTDKPVSAVKQQKTTATPLQALTDIRESKEGVTLYVDMPGVSKDKLEIDVDQNVLSIKGAINLNMPENLQPTFVDVRSERFERRFTLGEELDSERIEASFNQGELKLFIPRLEQHKSRKINVKVA